jgi:putative phosphoribosyl transferase
MVVKICMLSSETKIWEISELRNRTKVFRDREHAGMVLAEMMSDYKDENALVLGIPAGGIPVAAVLARELSLELDVAVVSKVTLPWNTEAGYGAVSWEGTVRLNQDLVSSIGLSKDEIHKGIEETMEKVKRRVKLFRGDRNWPNLGEETVILVDDGIASGFTILVAVMALKNMGVDELMVAVPTASPDSLNRLSADVKAIYCPNIRGGWTFAVADAYQEWRDVDEGEVLWIMENFFNLN